MVILYSIIFIWLFWGLYALVMALYRAKLNSELTPAIKLFGFPYLFIGYVFDVVCNLTLACIIFLELPQEMLVTGRLIRHLESKEGWRYSLAKSICNNLLDPLDPRGKHCD
jgi:hypothetical protein